MSNDDKRGKLLSELRKGKNLTQRDLGDLIWYTDKNISKWERGISFPNNPNIINKLAEIFDDEKTAEELSTTSSRDSIYNCLLSLEDKNA